MVSTRSLAKRARARDVGDADGTDGDDPPAAKRRRAGVATVTASIEPTTSKTRTSRKKVITTVPNQQVLANSFATPERSRKDPKPATKGAPVSRAVAAKAAEIIDLSDSSDEQTPTQQKPRETVTSTESTSALSLAQNAVRRRGSALALDPDCRERTVSQRTAGGLDHEERKLRSPETGSSASGFSQPRPSALPLGAFVPNGLLGFDMSRDERGHSGANVVGADEDDPIEGDDDHAFFRRKPPPSKRDTVMAVSKVTAGASVSASAFTLRSTRELDGSDNQSNVKDDGGGYEGSLDAILAGWRIPEPPLDDAERSVPVFTAAAPSTDAHTAHTPVRCTLSLNSRSADWSQFQFEFRTLSGLDARPDQPQSILGLATWTRWRSSGDGRCDLLCTSKVMGSCLILTHCHGFLRVFGSPAWRQWSCRRPSGWTDANLQQKIRQMGCGGQCDNFRDDLGYVNSSLMQQLAHYFGYLFSFFIVFQRPSATWARESS